ncbi:MAG: hypothetical protein Q6K80_07925 [Thermostichus sp. DG_1_6_bins_120]
MNIQNLVEQRQKARQTRNFAEADRIRQLLQEQGIPLVDAPNGETYWYSTVELD